LPLPAISKEHLKELQQFLFVYLQILKSIHDPQKSEKEKAQAILDLVQEKIKEQKTKLYSPLGYAPGLEQGGHAIPLKLRFINEMVEALLLNLGEGVEMHAQIDMALATPKFHFQYFPIHIELKKLLSERGVDTFARLVRLQNEVCSGEVGN